MMDINEIREYLPHRYPFLLVDRVVDLNVEEKRIRAYKNVSINEPFFNGHFPAHPIMPGVLIIEAMAQAAVSLVSKCSTSSLPTARFTISWVRTSCVFATRSPRVTS